MHEENRNIAEVFAPAKLNLWLHVGPRRADGYHPVCSLMDRVTLADTLQARRASGSGINLTVSGMDDTDPRENLVMSAALALERETGIPLEVKIDLIKKIPEAAGLGGGSSDAAAILKLLVFLFGLDVKETKLKEIAGSLGADVPFFLASGPQLAEGRGEILRPVRLGFDYAAVIINPGIRLPTADVYSLHDESGTVSEDDFARHVKQAQEDTNMLVTLDDLLGRLHNDLQPAAMMLCPEIGGIEKSLRDSGAAGTLLCGSGPSVFGLFEDREAAARAASGLKQTYPLTWAVTPVPRQA